MSIFECVVINCIYLAFPVTIYLMYVGYTRNMDIEEKDFFLELSLISALFLTVRYGIEHPYSYNLIFANVPLLIAYLKKKKKLAIIISVILIACYTTFLNISIFLVVGEYLVYYLLYIYIIKKKITLVKLISSFSIVKAFVMSLEVFIYFKPNDNIQYNLFKVFVVMFLFMLISAILLYCLKKGEKIVDLNVTLRELEREKKLRESLFKITHEIKNPLAVCKGYLDMIDNADQEKRVKFIKVIKSEIERSLFLMDDFLDYTKIKIVKEECDIYLLIEEVCSSLTTLFKKNNIETDFMIPDEELYIKLDYNRVKQVLVNVFKNSIEAQAEDRKMKITLQIKRQDNSITIRIKDNGIGIEDENLKQIGKMFFTTKKHGTGLGVSLSKEIIELHGGRMHYNSKKDKGTTVYIMLPLKEKKP